MSCHFKCENLCCPVAFIKSVCTTGDDGNIMMSWGLFFFSSFGKLWTLQVLCSPNATFSSSSFHSAYGVCEWVKSKLFYFSLWLGTIQHPRLVGGQSVYVVWNVRTCHAAATPQSTKSPAIMWCQIRWRLAREKKGKRRGEFWTRIKYTVAFFCNRPLRNLLCGAGGRWHWIEEGILGIYTRVGW